LQLPYKFGESSLDCGKVLVGFIKSLLGSSRLFFGIFQLNLLRFDNFHSFVVLHNGFAPRCNTEASC